MKCSYCGFTYDDELVCPICGTPAAQAEQPAPFTPQPAPTVQSAVPASSPEPAVKNKKKPAPAKKGKGLKIATFCVLSVIAAALVANVAIQAFSLSAELKHYRKSAEIMDKEKELYDKSFSLVESKPDIDSDYDGSDSGENSFSEKSDNKVHKVGESYDFGSGMITLKSVRVSQKTSNFDSAKQQVAFLVEVTNNTNSSQQYEIPSLTLGEKTDTEAFAFAEFNNSGDDVAYSLAPGESCSAVFCYNLPTENQTLNVTVSTEIQSGNCRVETVYSLETKDIK